MNIPQGYKQTELGIIPENWEVITVDDILDMPTKTISSSSFKTKYYVGTDNMCSLKRGVVPYCGMLPYSQVREYQTNDILVSNIRPYLKKIWLADKCGGCSSDVIVFRVKDSNHHCTAYIYTVLSDDAFFKYSMDSAIGTKMPRGDKFAIKTYSFAIPKDIVEQRMIAEVLSIVDKLIVALDKKIAKKRLIKQGAMQQLLTGKKRLPGFTEEWKEKKLGEICLFQNGYTPSKAIRHFWENGTIPWFRMEDIRTNGRILDHAFQYITNEAVKGNLFPAGSIIMSTTATIGEHALVIVDSLANQRFTNLIIRKSFDKQVDTIWFYHYCYTLGEWCRNNINEGGLAAVNMEDFSNVQITLPPILEQQAIATILSNMDKEIEELETRKEKYRLIKAGMMQKLLTGQIRLKTE